MRRRYAVASAIVLAAVVGTLGALAVGSGAGIGVTTALWAASLERDTTVATGAVGIAYDRLTAPATSDVAVASGSILTVELTEQDLADTLDAAPQVVAIALSVTMRADGNDGMSYSLALPTPRAGTIGGVSTVRLFPVASEAACTVAAVQTAAGAAQPNTSDIVGIPAETPAITTATDFWCLGAVYPGSGGTYTNTVSVQGSAPTSGLVATATDDWTGALVSDEPATLTHDVTRPGGP